MRTGKLNRRIIIQQRVTTQDTLGQPVETWNDVATVWADIRNPNGLSFANESIKAGAEASVARVSMRIRYREDIDTSMRVELNGETHDIVAVIPDHARRRHVDLLCQIAS